eukprot:3889799-Rhodomonas_salina.1
MHRFPVRVYNAHGTLSSAALKHAARDPAERKPRMAVITEQQRPRHGTEHTRHVTHCTRHAIDGG